MSDNKHKPVGENALQRVVRLLRKANDELVDVGTEEHLYYRMQTDGSGALLLSCEEKGVVKEVIFGFDSPEVLVKFLEARQLDRLLMVKAWAEK
jgi:hypothetical protein